jgi:hypothetical protein
MNTSSCQVRIKDKGVVGKMSLCSIADEEEGKVLSYQVDVGIEKRVRFSEQEVKISYRREREANNMWSR